MNFNSDASQANLAIQFKNVKLKLSSTNQNIRFNKQCLKHGVKPNYIHVNIKNNSFAAQKTKTMAEQSWLKNEIKYLYRKKNMLNTLLMKKHIELANSSHPAQLDSLLNNINCSISRIIETKIRKQTKKLKHLIDQQKPKECLITPNFKFFSRTINNTNILFNKNELSVLDKGLKYNIPKLGNQALFYELINAECAIKAIKNEEAQESARLIYSRKINSNNNKDNIKLSTTQSQDLIAIKSVKDKINKNDAILCKADKGNTIVVMYKNEYTKKVEEFIVNNNINKINKDPTGIYNKNIKRLINNSKVLFTDEEINRMKVMNPSAPRLRGLPKVHKPGSPIRPLVDYTSAPAYKLSKHLERILRTNIKFDNNYSLRNSYDFIEKTKNLNLSMHQSLVSFDIENLYTNVPIGRTIELVEENLNKNSEMLPEAITEFISLLNEVLKQNYFSFNNDFYKQNEGLAMGSPLSGILADIYLNHIENHFILSGDKNKHRHRIALYYRYVDDTIVLFDGTTRQLNILHNFLNSITPNLKFTMEIEKDNSINFLDLNISKNRDKFEFDIYRKPTTTDQTIHSTSYHPYNQKLAAYNSMIFRLLNIPLSKHNYKKELNTIMYIATANGYSHDLIIKLLNKQKNKIRPTQEIDLPYVCIEYNHRTHNYINKELRKQGIKLTYRTSNNIQSLTKTKHCIQDKYDKAGIYKLTCKECPSTYIGQTGRAFKIRFKEHHPVIKLEKQKSKFAQHVIDCNHNIDGINNSLDILHICKKGKLMNTLEEFQIYKEFKNNDCILNEKLNFRSHYIFNNILNINNSNNRLAVPDNTAVEDQGVGVT